jgi:hypothetical protein
MFDTFPLTFEFIKNIDEKGVMIESLPESMKA